MFICGKLGGSGCEDLECVFMINRNGRTNEEIIKEAENFGWKRVKKVKCDGTAGEGDW